MFLRLKIDYIIYLITKIEISQDISRDYEESCYEKLVTALFNEKY